MALHNMQTGNASEFRQIKCWHSSASKTCIPR